MRGTGRTAFANARVRALKSRLFGREMVGRLAHLASTAAVTGSVGDLTSLNDLAGRRFDELIAWYGTLIDAYPTGQSLFTALLRLHEIENVKLVWRALARRQPSGRWAPCWIGLGALETVREEDARGCTSLASLVEALKGSPYAAIGASMLRAHAADPLAAELGFDRWASGAIVEAAAALDRNDVGARNLALALVRERELNILRRATGSYGLSADAITGALVLLPHELTATEITTLVNWGPTAGPLWASLPRSWRHGPARPLDWDSLLHVMRLGRGAACRRAFLDQPFCLAPGVALLLLKEAEVRSIEAIAEAAGDIEGSPAFERTVAAGPMGS